MSRQLRSTASTSMLIVGVVTSKSDIIIYKPPTLSLIVFFGFGAGASSLAISNFSRSNENITGYKMSPNTSLNFADGLYFFDAGTGYKLVFTPEGNKNIGGVTVGIDGGCKLYISNAAKSYEQNVTTEDRRVLESTIENKISRTVFVPYVQMTIGFAGFKAVQSPTK